MLRPQTPILFCPLKFFVASAATVAEDWRKWTWYVSCPISNSINTINIQPNFQPNTWAISNRIGLADSGYPLFSLSLLLNLWYFCVPDSKQNLTLSIGCQHSRDMWHLAVFAKIQQKVSKFIALLTVALVVGCHLLSLSVIYKLAYHFETCLLWWDYQFFIFIFV